MSDHWHKKMEMYFRRIDFDKDGSITRKDFEGMAKRFAEYASPGAVDALTKRITSVYDNYLGSECGGKACDEKTFIEVMKKQKENPDMLSKLKGPLPLFFNAVDSDQDGKISRDEFKRFYEIVGIKSDSNAAFDAVDTDKDGVLSEEEFVTAGLDFFQKDEETPNSHFWGRLDEPQ